MKIQIKLYGDDGEKLAHKEVTIPFIMTPTEANLLLEALVKKAHEG